jgi:multiple sugar transport system ATP-binding protein
VAEVVVAGVTKRFGATVALRELDLRIPKGSFFVLLGPSGAGKTTLLRLIAGLDAPDHGDVRFDERSVLRESPAARNVAMVFQQYSLYPHMTVRENLAFPLRSPLLRTPEAEIERRVGDVARTLAIEGKLDRRVTLLSGGEMQRVSIGRAIVRDAALFLMDEPLSSLDAKLRADLRVELKLLHARLGATILYVTHDQIEAMTLATHAGVLVDGRLLQVAPPRTLYERPATIEVATRLGIPRINVLPADRFGPFESGYLLGVRPEHVEPTSGDDGVIHRIERLGDQTRVHVRSRGSEVVALVDPHTPLQVGASVALRFAQTLLFDASGKLLPTEA